MMMLRQPLHPSHESMVFRTWLGFVESEMSEKAQSQKKEDQPWPTSPCMHITTIDRTYVESPRISSKEILILAL